MKRGKLHAAFEVRQGCGSISKALLKSNRNFKDVRSEQKALPALDSSNISSLSTISTKCIGSKLYYLVWLLRLRYTSTVPRRPHNCDSMVECRTTYQRATGGIMDPVCQTVQGVELCARPTTFLEFSLKTWLKHESLESTSKWSNVEKMRKKLLFAFFTLLSVASVHFCPVQVLRERPNVLLASDTTR